MKECKKNMKEYNQEYERMWPKEYERTVRILLPVGT
jgi:hypothetical protein